MIELIPDKKNLTLEWILNLYDGIYGIRFDLGIPKQFILSLLYSEDPSVEKLIVNFQDSQSMRFKTKFLNCMRIWSDNFNSPLQNIISMYKNVLKDPGQKPRNVWVVEYGAEEGLNIENSDEVKSFIVSHYPKLLKYFKRWNSFNVNKEGIDMSIQTHKSNLNGIIGLFKDIEEKKPIIWLDIGLVWLVDGIKYAHANDCIIHNNDEELLVDYYEPNFSTDSEFSKEQYHKIYLNTLHTITDFLCVLTDKEVKINRVFIPDSCMYNSGFQNAQDGGKGLCALYSPYMAYIYLINKKNEKMKGQDDVSYVIARLGDRIYIALSLFMYFIYVMGDGNMKRIVDPQLEEYSKTTPALRLILDTKIKM
jgi:hypothetical protein